MLQAARCARNASEAELTDLAHHALTETALHACAIAHDCAEQDGENTTGFQDAYDHLEAIASWLFAMEGDLDLESEERRYALRCVFDWAARGAEPVKS